MSIKEITDSIIYIESLLKNLETKRNSHARCVRYAKDIQSLDNSIKIYRSILQVLQDKKRELENPHVLL